MFAKHKRCLYHFTLHVRKVTIVGTSNPPSAPVRVEWSRGSHLEITEAKSIPRSGSNAGSVDFEETLRLTCTMFITSSEDKPTKTTFLPKPATLKLCEGRICLGKGKIDLALYAICVEPKNLVLTLTRSGRSVGMLSFRISARAGDFPGSDAESTASEASSMASGSFASEHDIANLADLTNHDVVSADMILTGCHNRRAGNSAGSTCGIESELNELFGLEKIKVRLGMHAEEGNNPFNSFSASVESLSSPKHDSATLRKACNECRRLQVCDDVRATDLGLFQL